MLQFNKQPKTLSGLNSSGYATWHKIMDEEVIATRIDYCLVPTDYLCKVTICGILDFDNKLFADHNAITVSLHLQLYHPAKKVVPHCHLKNPKE